MASFVKDLIPESQKLNLVTAIETETLQSALSKMIEHDFSQLPVLDEQSNLKGLVTSDSILRSVSYFKAPLDKIKVSHAVFNSKTCRLDDELSELLSKLNDVGAIPVIDNTEKLIAIITHYDTTAYYRQRAEDIMLAEDIETTLRDDYLKSIYTNQDGELNEDVLQTDINKIGKSIQGTKKQLKKFLRHYLNEANIDSRQINIELVDALYPTHFPKNDISRNLEDLTLYDYIQIFKINWNKFESGFNDLEWDAVHRLLDEVRKTRNAIAHFKGVTPEQQKQLQFCASLLDRHKSKLDISGYLETTGMIGSMSNHAFYIPKEGYFIPKGGFHIPTISQEEGILEPIEEEIDAKESQYASLAIYLQNQVPTEQSRVEVTFDQIENIIFPKQLPTSARKHRAWWANDSVSHPQSKQWLEVGWRVSNLNISSERVVFSRIGDRQTAYINFFSYLSSQLQTVQELLIKPGMTSQGRNWFFVKVTPLDEVSKDDHPKIMWLCFSFDRRSRFRIESYIDSLDHKRNKEIFDTLHDQKSEIEKQFGDSLSWERLESKRAVRIAYYRDNSSITGSQDELEQIRDWSCKNIVRFYNAIEPYFHTAILDGESSEAS